MNSSSVSQPFADLRQWNEELVGYHEFVLNAKVHGKVRKAVSERIKTYMQQKIIEFSVVGMMI